MDEQAIRNDILVGFQYSYLHDSWVNPLEEALADITLEELLQRPTPESKCIWEMVLHLALWHENIVERIETGEKAHPKEPAWPPLPDKPDLAAWEISKKRLWDSLALIEKTIQTAPFEKLMTSAYGLPDLICRITHNGYHIGQITKQRECLSGRL